MGDIPWRSPHTTHNTATTWTLAGRKEGKRKEVLRVIGHQMAATYSLNPILPQTMVKTCPPFPPSVSLPCYVFIIAAICFHALSVCCRSGRLLNKLSALHTGLTTTPAI